VFSDLDDRMQAAAATTDDPFDGLRLRGLAYAEFALANPEQYRLAMMRMPATHGFDKHTYGPFAAEDIVAGPTYRHLIEAVQRCIDAGVFAQGTDPDVVATSLWAATHGAVSLCLAKPGLAGDHALAICEMVIDNAGLGAALGSHLGEDTDHAHASPLLAGLLIAGYTARFDYRWPGRRGVRRRQAEAAGPSTASPAPRWPGMSPSRARTSAAR